MADDYFDLDSLSAYLHLGVGQVARLVERGKLPGRRVAGQWRFSPAEINQWLEARIALPEDEELLQMDSILQLDESSPSFEPISLAEMLPVESIDVPLAARTRGSVISELVETAARTGWLWDAPKMIEAVRQRESLHPTAMENGVALLHPRRPLTNILGQAFLAFGRTERGIPFGGRNLTDLFFLICSIDDRGHLRTLSRLSQVLSKDDVLTQLRAAADANAVREIIAAAEGGET